MKRSGRQRRQGNPAARDSLEVPRTKFAVDAMLGSLARKLRALGFDALYYRSGEDSELLGLSLRDGRVILTADRSLAARAESKGARVILASGSSDGERIGSIARGAASKGIDLVRGAPLCSLCGGELLAAGKDRVRGVVPPAVMGRHRFFFVCAACGQVYWRGSHWKKLMSLARRLGRKQDAAVPDRRSSRGKAR